jgi:hypothetical protein
MKSLNVEVGVIPYNGMELLTKNVNNIVWVAMKPIVEAMGLSWSTQKRKIEGDKRGNAGYVKFGRLSNPCILVLNKSKQSKKGFKRTNYIISK